MKILFVVLLPFSFSQDGPVSSYQSLLDLAERSISLSQTQLLKVSIPAVGSKSSQRQKDCKILSEYVIESQRSLVAFQKSPNERNGFQKSQFITRYKELDRRFTEVFASQKTSCPSPAPKEEVRRSRRTEA